MTLFLYKHNLRYLSKKWKEIKAHTVNVYTLVLRVCIKMTITCCLLG